MKKLYPFIGLVGPSGSGKTSLILELCKRLPDKVAVLRSLTTREPRPEDPTEHVFYDFLTVEDMVRRSDKGRFTHMVEYAKNYYALDCDMMDALFAERAGLQALVESSFAPIRAHGYELVLVRIEPKGLIDSRSETRKAEDAKRKTLAYDVDATIVNDFQDPDGFAKAANQLTMFVERLLAGR